LSYRFLSLNDPQGLHTVRVGVAEFQVSGHAQSKAQFVFAALRAAGRDPSLVVALHPHLAPVMEMMKLRSSKFHSIVFAHGIEVWRPLGWPRGPALRRATLATAPSEDTAQHLIADQRIDPQKIRRLPWGLDPEFEARLAMSNQAARPQEFPEHGPIILTVGRWDSGERYKGADNLLSALPTVLKLFPDAVLVLVGDGDDRKRLEQLAHDLGVSGSTRFLRGLTQDQLFACYANCDVFALPSRGEGFGLVFLEAMAHAKPVIGGAHGGIPDIVQDGATGLLVSHGDINRLASALETVLADPQYAKQMGIKGRERVLSVYKFENFESGLAQIVEECLAG
jgi:phosphatidylinositol alpha-1,6-mannosyltransferase